MAQPSTPPAAAAAGTSAVDAGAPDAAPEPMTCPAGRGDCDADASNGCETDLGSDARHCGACEVACEAPDCVCAGGELDVACRAGRGDCNADPTDGCETDLTSDEQSCGACGLACADSGPYVSGASCEDALCVLVCTTPTLRGNCDGDPENGCETDLFHDENNCGTCGTQCSLCADSVCL